MRIGRRAFLTGCAAAGAASLLPQARSFAQGGAAGRLFRIDTHSHFTIPKLYALATARGVQQATLEKWTPEVSLKQMEEGGVATSIISISDPGVFELCDQVCGGVRRQLEELETILQA